MLTRASTQMAIFVFRVETRTAGRTVSSLLTTVIAIINKDLTPLRGY